jgi:hypothetical protein
MGQSVFNAVPQVTTVPIIFETGLGCEVVEIAEHIETRKMDPHR